MVCLDGEPEYLVMNRRQFVVMTGSAMAGMPGLLAGCASGRRQANARSADRLDRLGEAFARVESEVSGRLGVAVLDTHTGARAGHRADERFPMCSTFKLLAVAGTLARVDAGKEDLQRRVRFSEADLITYSPVTKEHVGGEGMTVAELCEAAMIVSDNTAGNLLLRDLGGPAGLTAYARTLGDAHTRLDRNEPDLNEAIPGDPRDTTTPGVMLANLDQLAFNNALRPSSRELLVHWLVSNKTGDTRLRAGVPTGWRVGDKTGSGDHGTSNDVGILWPPGRKPILVCVYLTDSSKGSEERSAAIGSIARAVAANSV